MDTLYKFENCLRLIHNEDKESIIIGDVNSDISSSDPTHLVSEMDFITKLYQYEQLIKDSTRVTKDSASLIDHFCTTKPDCITSSEVRIITISDHYLIYGVCKFQVTKQSPRIIEYQDFKQFNEINFLLELQLSINLNLDHLDPNNSWSIWKDTFLNIVNKHASLKKRVNEYREHDYLA